jgi:sugar lactone lactonase YvrE
LHLNANPIPEGELKMNQVESVPNVTNALGEGPIWVEEESALYWVDIDERKIFRYRPSTGELESFEVETRVTALAVCASGGFITATDRGLAFWDTQSQKLSFIADPEADKTSTRFNDGAVDRQGRFWAGTMNEVDFVSPDGSLYRLDRDGSLHTVEREIPVSNGIGWSPDNRTMYFTDTMRQVIWAYEFDPVTGGISNRRPFVQISEEGVLPDGLTVDSEGFVWSAQWNGWSVTRYDPRGQVDQVIELPAQQITCPAFGGENLDELYITSAWSGLSKGEREKQPMAGALFRVKVGVKGIAEPKFAG